MYVSWTSAGFVDFCPLFGQFFGILMAELIFCTIRPIFYLSSSRFWETEERNYLASRIHEPVEPIRAHLLVPKSSTSEPWRRRMIVRKLTQFSRFWKNQKSRKLSGFWSFSSRYSKIFFLWYVKKFLNYLPNTSSNMTFVFWGLWKVLRAKSVKLSRKKCAFDAFLAYFYSNPTPFARSTFGRPQTPKHVA